MSPGLWARAEAVGQGWGCGSGMGLGARAGAVEQSRKAVSEEPMSSLEHKVGISVTDLSHEAGFVFRSSIQNHTRFLDLAHGGAYGL